MPVAHATRTKSTLAVRDRHASGKTAEVEMKRDFSKALQRMILSALKATDFLISSSPFNDTKPCPNMSDPNSSLYAQRGSVPTPLHYGLEFTRYWNC